jgi:hypothetical protein
LLPLASYCMTPTSETCFTSVHADYFRRAHIACA